MDAEERAERLVKVGPMLTGCAPPPEGIYWVYLGDHAICSLGCTEAEALRIAEPYRKVIADAIREAEGRGFNAGVRAQHEMDKKSARDAADGEGEFPSRNGPHNVADAVQEGDYAAGYDPDYGWDVCFPKE